MTESEWMAATDPHDHLYLKICRSSRKRRLLACACVRRILDLLPDDRFPPLIEVAERLADGLASAADLKAACLKAELAIDELQAYEETHTAFAAQAILSSLQRSFLDFKHTFYDAQAARGAVTQPDWNAGRKPEALAQCALFRDIFRDPCHPEPGDRAWLTWKGATIRQLARCIYDDRAFDRLPILADAIEEAGCADLFLLDHCRSGGDHVRGCWAVDACLGSK